MESFPEEQLAEGELSEKSSQLKAGGEMLTLIREPSGHGDTERVNLESGASGGVSVTQCWDGGQERSRAAKGT